MKPAPDPSDIYWENLSISNIDRIKKTAFTYLITVICLMCSFALNLGIGYLKDKLEKDTKNTNTELSSAYFCIMAGINTINAMIVAFINFSMGQIIRRLTLLERHETYTKHNISVTIKLTWAMFVNTGIIPLFVNYYETSWFTPSGLCTDVFFNELAVCFIGPIFYVLDPLYLSKVMDRDTEIKKAHKSRMTQRQLNELFEGQKFDMAQRYSVTLSLMMICVLYISILPAISIVAILGCVCQYWITKIMLLRRHSTPQKLGKDLDKYIQSFLPVLTLLYSIGLFYFIYDLSDGRNWLIYLPLLIPVIHFCIPRQKLKFIFKNATNSNSIDESTLTTKINEFIHSYNQWNFDFQENCEISSNFSQDLDNLEENLQQKVKELNIYKKKLSLDKIIEYGIRNQTNETIWDPLFEKNFNPMELRRANSVLPTPKSGMSKKFTMIDLNAGNKPRSMASNINFISRFNQLRKNKFSADTPTRDSPNLEIFEQECIYGKDEFPTLKAKFINSFSRDFIMKKTLTPVKSDFEGSSSDQSSSLREYNQDEEEEDDLESSSDEESENESTQHGFNKSEN